MMDVKSVSAIADHHRAGPSAPLLHRSAWRVHARARKLREEPQSAASRVSAPRRQADREPRKEERRRVVRGGRTPPIACDRGEGDDLAEPRSDSAVVDPSGPFGETASGRRVGSRPRNQTARTTMGRLRARQGDWAEDGCE